jgi:hypothetical protein
VNEDALRTLVRAAIARLEAGPSPGAAPDPTTLLDFSGHPSHYRYRLIQSDGPCLIEPGVRCNHCGYCESHGH